MVKTINKQPEPQVVTLKSSPKTEAVDDQKRRLFLKILGSAGIGVVAATMAPKKAHALIMGGTPGTSVMGVKNASNTRVDPATEATLATIGKETTLSGIKTATDKFQFDSSNNLKVTGGSGSDIVSLKDSASNTINPSSEEALIYLRRMVKLMESQATVDSANRQRVTVEGATITSGTITTVTTVTTCSTVTSATNLVTIGSWDARQMFQDQAHNVYANSIRRNLTFS